MSNERRAPIRALGLMSGTSLDGIDIALIESDGIYDVARGPSACYPYSHAFRSQLRAGLEDAKSIRARQERPGRLGLLEQYLTDLHVEAIDYFLSDHDIERTSIEVVGFHGQTVLHRPESGLTVQLGDGPRLATATGLNVFCDMRAADCVAGGVGAPLAPAYHRAILHKLPSAAAVLNLGGVANVTWLKGGGSHEDLLAFDTGPGSALIDDWMQAQTGEPMDRDGKAAAEGTADEAALQALLANSYFSKTPPKALDRNDFDMRPISSLSVSNGAATLTAFTARSVAHALTFMPERPELWVVTGGGRHNASLMQAIAAAVDAKVVAAEAVGLNGDSVEAEAWAYLAIRSQSGLALTFPGTTGVATPTCGGVVCRPS